MLKGTREGAQGQAPDSTKERFRQVEVDGGAVRLRGTLFFSRNGV